MRKYRCELGTDRCFFKEVDESMLMSDVLLKGTIRIPSNTLLYAMNILLFALLPLLAVSSVEPTCDDIVQGGVGDPLFCRGEVETVLTHKGLTLTVPSGWLFGVNDNRIKIQKNPLKEMGSMLIRFNVLDAKQRVHHHEKSGLECSEQQIQRQTWQCCSGSLSGIYYLNAYAKFRKGYIHVGYSFPWRYRDHFLETFEEIKNSIALN